MHFPPPLLLRAALVGLTALAACGRAPAPDVPADVRGDTPTAVAVAAPPAPLSGLLPIPAESVVTDTVLLASVRRGRALLAATPESLPRYARSALRCTSCHLDDGRRAGAMPWVGVYGQFPQYRAREGTVIRLEDRINNCLRRSLNGRALPHDAPAMRDMVAYMAFLSRGVPVGGRVAGQGMPPVAPLAPDTGHGRLVYAESCARCHGVNGGGGTAPAVWGARSFNVGAGMARLRTAAAFVRHNMPYDRPRTLSDQDAYDVAAWVVSRPRPDLPGKANDWPHGDPPPDAAYPTRAATRRTDRP